MAAAIGGVVGLAWSVLYDATLRYALVLVIAHVIAAAAVGSVVSIAVRGKSTATGASFAPQAGAIVGLLWMGPILLFLIDYRDFDIRVDAVGLVVVVAVSLGCTGLCAVAAGLAARLGRAAGIAVACLVAVVAAAVSFARLGGPPAPSIEIEARLDRAPVVSAAPAPRRAMVLGIDGASWNVLLPMLRAGKLPHLRSLMEGGRYGVLESVRSDSGDTASPVVWTSVFTGTRPERHGIRDWLVSDSRNRQRKALWNILNDQGRPAIVVNVPGTFPPEVVDGAMISGFPIPGVVRPVSSRFQIAAGRVYSTQPEEDGVVPSTRVHWARERSDAFEIPIVASLEMKYGRLRHRAYDLRLGNLFAELAERRGYFQARVLERFSATPVDATGAGQPTELHLARGADGARPFAVLGEGEWTEWLEVRFHGVALALKLRLNELSNERIELYATPLFQSSADPVLPFTYPLNLGRQLSSRQGQYVVEGAGWTIHEDEDLLDPLFEHVLDVGARHVAASQALLDATPDWALFTHLFTESDRIQHAYWPFHAPEAYRQVDPGLVSAHGDKVAQVMESVDGWIGEFLAWADDDTLLVVVSDHGFRPGPETNRGEHSMDGIFVFSGAGVAGDALDLDVPVEELPRAGVADITPTILFLMGYPTASDFDGRVLTELVDATTLHANEQLTPIETYESAGGSSREDRTLDDSTIEQLKSLGYVK